MAETKQKLIRDLEIALALYADDDRESYPILRLLRARMKEPADVARILELRTRPQIAAHPSIRRVLEDYDLAFLIDRHQLIRKPVTPGDNNETKNK